MYDLGELVVWARDPQNLGTVLELELDRMDREPRVLIAWNDSNYLRPAGTWVEMSRLREVN